MPKNCYNMVKILLEQVSIFRSTPTSNYNLPTEYCRHTVWWLITIDFLLLDVSNSFCFHSRGRCSLRLMYFYISRQPCLHQPILQNKEKNEKLEKGTPTDQSLKGYSKSRHFLTHICVALFDHRMYNFHQQNDTSNMHTCSITLNPYVHLLIIVEYHWPECERLSSL